MSETSFSALLLAWHAHAGRHDLPWQNTQDPYAVWLSEIMLQQTQVVTVIDYYHRFLQRFPTVFELAQASSDEVLALWSGLGYYSRARHLHRCAQQVVQDGAGQFPRHSADLAQLCGIGPSTAAAIASICHQERVAIFDGNVQRVLARHTAFDADLAQTASLRALRDVAQQRLPEARDMPVYTQAIMDLGATLCTRSRPACALCPLQDDCVARATGRQALLPTGKPPAKTRRVRRVVALRSAHHHIVAATGIRPRGRKDQQRQQHKGQGPAQQGRRDLGDRPRPQAGTDECQARGDQQCAPGHVNMTAVTPGGERGAPYRGRLVGAQHSRRRGGGKGCKQGGHQNQATAAHDRIDKSGQRGGQRHQYQIHSR